MSTLDLDYEIDIFCNNTKNLLTALKEKEQIKKENRKIKHNLRQKMRFKNKMTDPKERKAYNSRAIFKRRLKTGDIKRGEKCEICGHNKHIVGHHDDYDKPLEVTWLCRKCHNVVHSLKEFL